MTEFIGLVSTILAVTGVILNNRKLTSCFYLWIVSNLLSAWLHYDAGIYSLLIRDLVFFVLAIEGLIMWKNKKC